MLLLMMMMMLLLLLLLMMMMMECRFSFQMSSCEAMTCGAATCLTSCHLRFVSNSCHFLTATSAASPEGAGQDGY